MPVYCQCHKSVLPKMSTYGDQTRRRWVLYLSTRHKKCKLCLVVLFYLLIGITVKEWQKLKEMFRTHCGTTTGK